MDQLTFIRLLGRYWWLITLALMVGLGSTAYFTYKHTPVYRASTTVVVGPSEKLTTVDDVVRSLSVLARRSVVATYAQVSSSRSVQDRAQKQLGLSSSQMRRYKVRTSVLPDANILRVAVEGPNPRVAAAVANAIVEQAQSYAQEFYDGVLGLKVLDRAREPSEPVSPKLSRSLGVGAILGLFLGLGLAFLAESVRRLKHPHGERSGKEPEAKQYV